MLGADSPEMSRLQQLLKQLPPIKVDLPGEPEFTLFSRLPNELKNNVWKHLVSEPRCVRIYDIMESWELQSPVIGTYHFDLSPRDMLWRMCFLSAPSLEMN